MNPFAVLMPTHNALSKLLSKVGTASRTSPKTPSPHRRGQSEGNPPPTSPASLKSLYDHIAAFQRIRFPDQPLSGKLTHLAHEAKELRDCAGQDWAEWADVFILLLGAAAQAGLTIEDLVNAANAKMTINEHRTWGPPDAEGVCHHLDAVPALPNDRHVRSVRVPFVP